MDTNQNQPSNTAQPVTPAPAQPAAPSATPAPTPGTTPPPTDPAKPVEGQPNTQDSGQTPPPAGKNKKGLIAAAVIFLVLLVGTAAVLFTQNSTTQMGARTTPAPSVGNQSVPTTAPQTIEDEVEAVDTGASESSDLKEVEKDINSL